MKNTFSQAMAWLHTWAGLVIGWLLFVIFVGGTIACFDKELTHWMQPALHGHERSADSVNLANAVEQLQKIAKPHPHAYYVTLPGERGKSLDGGVYYDAGTPDMVTLDPASGQKIPETAGGEFFFTLHYNLHAETWGMYIVGLAGMFMLIAILTGIVIHKRIFKDFFTFRPKNGGQRAWLDGHNLTGVLGLPFHLMIAYTGVAIFVANYMPAGLFAAYNGDAEKFFVEASDSYERPETHQALKRIYPIDTLVSDARARLGQPVTWVSVHHPDDTSATISFGGDHSRDVAWNYRSVFYDANDGKFLHQSGPMAPGYQTYTFIGGMHMAQWGGSALRWLYFVMGIAGCVMIASGMQVWVSKRAKKIAEAGNVSGYALVQALNLGVVGGLPLASAAMAIGNRLIPADLAARANAEIAVFCAVWIAATLYAAIPAVHKRGWGRFFAINAGAFALIPLVNFATAPNSHLFATIGRGDWSLAAVDLTALALAAGFAALARHSFVKARRPVEARKPHRDDRAGANQPALADR
ncbi:MULTISPECIES: PepSY-associated TM helix domain-containing protein [unclassified Lysobacter]|uniref:PepSY-associated TM helix domain-containing protein n=1 Tax=unclassified Lysobacter TaxID=2635362 RepID=UPI001BEC864B|nr:MULTISPECIES: PepSY-associated TM helix domain-containing protein [unclassified Lysobacter]MBT2745486.1 PepSY domain-containing protein [Lysobacter sp. ISL-42]MBT2777028.1 PepSY domain-containing protein [Lysobacter sp. ISL-54]MBT2781548.1 PepSY domain-containing protein [Lysobacter sp. ISL-52]